MPKKSRPRHGSLQFWPRKRIRKALPSVNWNPISVKSDGILGFIGYKVGMASAIVKDNYDKSMTKGKRIVVPSTILEVPNMKIFSVRFYKNGKVMKDVVVSHDKELKRKLKVPKTLGSVDGVSGFDDVRVVVYSVVKNTDVKKTPDIIELAVHSSDKLGFVKNLIGKEISLHDVLKQELYDVRGLTTGKGIVGPVKRFGAQLRPHKSEKGVRKVGSLGPWHPAHVTFRAPISGQFGTFTRVIYNLRVLSSGKISEKDINRNEGFKNYGKIRTSYVVIAGSVQGPAKRQVLVTPAMRPSKKQSKKKIEFVELA
jgi:large subunit ribosomal protein L3